MFFSVNFKEGHYTEFESNNLDTLVAEIITWDVTDINEIDSVWTANDVNVVTDVMELVNEQRTATNTLAISNDIDAMACVMECDNKVANLPLMGGMVQCESHILQWYGLETIEECIENESKAIYYTGDDY